MYLVVSSLFTPSYGRLPRRVLLKVVSRTGPLLCRLCLQPRWCIQYSPRKAFIPLVSVRPPSFCSITFLSIALCFWWQSYCFFFRIKSIITIIIVNIIYRETGIAFRLHTVRSSFVKLRNPILSLISFSSSFEKIIRKNRFVVERKKMSISIVFFVVREFMLSDKIVFCHFLVCLIG